MGRGGMGSTWVEMRGPWHDEKRLPASIYTTYRLGSPSPASWKALHAERQRNGRNRGGKSIRQSGGPGDGGGGRHQKLDAGLIVWPASHSHGPWEP